MKTLFTPILFLIFGFCFSQNAPIDFQTNGNGLNWTWTTFENDTNPPLEIVPNPDTTGINTSSTVAKFTALQNGAAWAGCESQHGSDIGSFSLNNNNCTVTIMVWKPVISDVGIKFVDATNAAQIEIKVPNTLTYQWEELTFDFSSRIGVYPIVKDQIVIFPDFDLNGRTKDNIIYFDNIWGASSNTGIRDLSESQVEVYPNPSNSQVTIDIKNYSGEKTISVFDLMGNQIFTTNKTKVEVGDFAKGIYLFKVSYGSKTDVIKVLKE